MMMIHDRGHSIAFHIDATGEDPDMASASREGIWWLPNEAATDQLVVTNQSARELHADLSIYDSAGREAKQKLILPPRATTRLSTRQLVRANGLSGTFGGVRLFVPSHGGSLDSVHLLFDETSSFSAFLKMFNHSPKTTMEERDFAHTKTWTLRAPMLALSRPDPALAFPEGTVLNPQLFIHNTMGKPVDVNLRFAWRSGSATGKVAGPSLHLGSFETQHVDVAALQASNALPKDANWTSVLLISNGLPEEVVALAASYDQTLRYGAQTPFSDQLAFEWVGSLWEYDIQHNSLITAGNGGTKPVQASFTIYYNGGTQKYELEQPLQPDEQMWIDVGKLIREQTPDKNGKLLPQDLTSGSYELRDLSDKFIGSLYEGKIVYDKTFGHVTYGCANCCGYGLSLALWYDPLGIPFQSTSGNGANAFDSCTGLWDDVSDAADGNWTTTNSSIATVDYYGTHTGQGIGSTTSSTSALLQVSSIHVTCPLRRNTGRGNDNVASVKILLGGSGGTNITNTTQSAVVGQQIVLYASDTLPSGATPGSMSWSIPGPVPTNYVGGFNHTLTSGGYTQPTLNQQLTTFYWVAAANSQTVKFTLNYTDSTGHGQSVQAQATFNVSGPTSASLAPPPLGDVDINPGPILQFGNLATAGITFTASATPPSGYSNSFVWVQINTNDALLLTMNNNTTQTCNWTTQPVGGDPYLDTTYPYDTRNPTSDSPSAALDSTQYKELIRNFSATMYLMWTSNLPNAIPIPLGSISWQWSGDATYSTSSGWTVSGYSKSVGGFQSSNVFPYWSRYSDYSTRNCH